MRRLLVLIALFAFVGCSASARNARDRAFTSPREGAMPPFAVATLLYQRDSNGSIADETPVGVLLTRPIRTPLSLGKVLSLVDQNDHAAEGSVESPDAQLLVFRPKNPWPRGKVFRVMLTVPVVAEDGATLPAGELAKLHTEPIVLAESGIHGKLSFLPFSTFYLSFGAKVSTTDVMEHGHLHVAGETLAVPFEVRNKVSSDTLLVTPTRAMPPGTILHFQWKEGPIAITSVGAVKLHPPVEVVVQKGLRVIKLGDGKDQNCTKGNASPGLTVFHCKQAADSIDLTFSSPLSMGEIATHVQIGKGSTVVLLDTIDGKSHRLRVSGFAPYGVGKWMRLVLQPELTDVFGSKFERQEKINLEKLDP